jgi:hypothetical protein
VPNSFQNGNSSCFIVDFSRKKLAFFVNVRIIREHQPNQGGWYAAGGWHQQKTKKEIIPMKLKTVAIAAAALALAVGMTACGGAASTAASSTASSTASSAAASSEAASSEVVSSEAEATSAEYTVYNTTGSKVTELYLYDAGSEDKGENLAGEGLADGESIVITRDVEADKQADVVYVLEFTTEDGNTQSFDTLHYEVAPISLKSVDAAAGATAIAFEAPQK